jgi:outer membrane protein TolC
MTQKQTALVSTCFRITTILAFALCFSSQADLTLQDCMKEAADRNPSVLMAIDGVRSAEALYNGAYTNFFPQLSASAGVTETNGEVSQSVGSIITGSQNGQPITTYSAGINLTQSVFNGFTDVGKVKEAKANLEAARAALKLAKVATAASVKTNFAQLLFAQKSVELAITQLKREQSSLRLITLRFEGGQENKGNLMYQAAIVSQAVWQVNHTRRTDLLNSKQLAVILGRPENDQTLKLKGELEGKLPKESEESFHKIVATHPSHTQAYFQMLSADANIQVVDGNWFPNFNLTGFLGESGPNFPPNGVRWSVGAAVSFPFFPGTSNIYNSANARALKSQADYNIANNDATLYSNVEQMYANLADDIEQLKVNQEFQEAATARSVIATQKYNTGLMTFEDWSVIEEDLITREQNLLSSQSTAMQGEAAWEEAIGVGAIP